MMDKDRFYIKIEDGKYQLYDRIKEYSFNPISEEWFVVQIKDLLNNLHEENQQLKKSEELLSECSHHQKQRMKYYIENIELKQSNERLLKMLDNVANYMQKQNKYMSIPDFVEWWNGIATKGLDDGDV